jgi:glycosyltransferase involved in cell wall biosynthesis
MVSFLTERCYAISIDAADIAIRYSGVERKKLSVCPLGVDTDIFRPPINPVEQQARSQLRRELGFSESDVVCIYTGRLSEDKNPLCLAQAIEILGGRGKPFRGLFVGNGPQAKAICALGRSVIHPFVSFRELPRFYWAADIGVWPRQESTSQLDAAACGLPIILSNRVQVLERVDGNGLIYEEDNLHELVRKLEALSDPEVHRRFGAFGARKMRERFSWDRIGRQRIRDYEEALRV